MAEQTYNVLKALGRTQTSWASTDNENVNIA